MTRKPPASKKGRGIHLRAPSLPEASSAALDGLFDAVVFPDLWPGALDRLAESMGAAGAVVVPFDPQMIELGFPTSHLLKDVMTAFVQGGWHRDDIRSQRARPMFAGGRAVVTEHDLVTEEERRRLPYYGELFNPFGLPWFAGVGFRVDGKLWCLTLIRGAGQGAYTPADVHHFGAVSSSLKRIVSLAFQVRQAMEGPIVAAAQGLGANAIILDALGHIISIGPHAASLLGRELYIRSNRLVAASIDENTALQAVVAAAVRTPSPARQPEPAIVPVRRSGLRPLMVEAIALPGLARDVFSRAVALLLLRDLEETAALPDADLLRRAFGFTPGEARVAALVGTGASAGEAAAQLGIAYETARTVLQRVYDKAGVGRQSELASLLARVQRDR